MSALGRKVTVELVDSLLPNTTYTIDFSNSIQDNNEGNAIDNFAFAFSTGSVIDSMRMSGYVLDSALWSQCRASWWGCKAILPTPPFTRRNCNAWR